MKRKIKKQFWCNEKENNTLKDKANRCGITEAAFLRLIIMGIVPKEKPDKAFYDVMRNLSSMTNSLNQVAAKANSLDFVDVSLLMKAIGSIEKMQDDLHEYFIKPDRDTHLNTKCLHCHFVINSVSFTDGKMMHGKEKAWFYFHHIADEICREYKLSVIENPQRIKNSDFLIEQDSKGQPTRYNLLREAIDEAINNSCNKQEFEYYLKKMGYKYRLSDNLKY